LRGRQRVKTEWIIAFRSHWGYQSEYCIPAKANEKRWSGCQGDQAHVLTGPSRPHGVRKISPIAASREA
ncbi:MAG TPA: hypothetical protein VMT86_06850, partial [Bryobacteraceae bacterium]|nr:hypothetical protein [Bryobacteraceae bacterium]